jgi:cyanate permease
MRQKQLLYNQPTPSRPPSLVVPNQTRYRFVIMGLLFFMHLSIGLGFFVLSPITPLIMDEYGIARATAGLLTGIVMGVQVALALPASMLIGRIQLKLLVTFALILLGTMSLSFLAGNFLSFFGMRILFGLGCAILFPCIPSLLMGWFAQKELPLVNGLNITALTAGNAIGVFAAAPLAEIVEWQTAVSLIGILPVIGTVLWVVYGKVPEKTYRGQDNLSVRNFFKVLRSRVALLLAFGDAGPFALYTALTAWLPSFYFETHGLSLTTAGAMVGILPLMGMVVVPAVAVFSMHFIRRKPVFILSGILVGTAGFGTFLLAGTWAVYPALILVGIGCWLYIPSLMTLPMELPNARPEEVAVIFAVLMALSGSATFLAPFLVGAMTDMFGSYIPGFTIFAISAWSVLVAGIFLPEPNRQSP